MPAESISKPKKNTRLDNIKSLNAEIFLENSWKTNLEQKTIIKKYIRIMVTA